MVSYDRMAMAPVRHITKEPSNSNILKKEDVSNKIFEREFPPRKPKLRRSPRIAAKALLIPDATALIREAQKPRLFYRKFIKSYDRQKQRYRVRWVGLPPHLDTYEIESQLPYHMVSTYKRVHNIT